MKFTYDCAVGYLNLYIYFRVHICMFALLNLK